MELSTEIARSKSVVGVDVVVDCTGCAASVDARPLRVEWTAPVADVVLRSKIVVGAIGATRGA